MMVHLLRTFLLFLLVLPMTAYSADHLGTRSDSAGPQGFELSTLTSVKDVKERSIDDQLVCVRGRFTEWIKGDKYWFVDEAGDGIVTELDDDYDWSHIRKDQFVEIFAEVDKEWFDIELKVIRAKPLN
ncbi:MAG TPA: NirD/YgiW/YdeI family stress tolerance protein [Candidatus Aphodousia faecipullorum]|mgnify:CR=1 FL=1|nr:NirD/YgiW/YdeI family stress tolerance protein [Candidatus Aphodousia faecipullorum]